MGYSKGLKSGHMWITCVCVILSKSLIHREHSKIVLVLLTKNVKNDKTGFISILMSWVEWGKMIHSDPWKLSIN